MMRIRKQAHFEVLTDFMIQSYIEVTQPVHREFMGEVVI